MLNYVEPVFRPPSEGRSLILQVTNGCSWNKCTFCDMYTQPQKKFKAKPEEAKSSEKAAKDDEIAILQKEIVQLKLKLGKKEAG